MDAMQWLFHAGRPSGVKRSGHAACFSARDNAPLRALVVDDQPIHRMLITGMMQLLFPAVSVEMAEGGRQAQAMIKEGGYGIVLSDWFMPDVDGLQLAKWLHSGEVQPCPYVLFSVHDEIAEIESLFSSPGIDGYLIKPFDQRVMAEVISSALGGSIVAA